MLQSSYWDAVCEWTIHGPDIGASVRVHELLVKTPSAKRQSGVVSARSNTLRRTGKSIIPPVEDYVSAVFLNIESRTGI